jgi:hypothetical protein
VQTGSIFLGTFVLLLGVAWWGVPFLDEQIVRFLGQTMYISLPSFLYFSGENVLFFAAFLGGLFGLSWLSFFWEVQKMNVGRFIR